MTLRGTRPPIWRRLEVASDLTLGRLYEVLQIAMGWTDDHLHAFVADGVEYGTRDPEWGTRVRDESRVRLTRVLRKPKDRLTYEYDIGDHPEHVEMREWVGDVFDPAVFGIEEASLFLRGAGG